MPKPHNGTKLHRDKELSVKTGLIFYSIIALGVLLPVVVAVCVIFLDIFVTVLVSAVFLSVLVWLIFLYRKMKKQLEAFCRVIETGKLLEGEHEISVLGGLLDIRIEEKKPLPPPGKTQDQDAEPTDDPKANYPP